MPQILRTLENRALNRYEPHYVPEPSGRTLITTTEFNIINGHDYTDAEFSEVDSKDDKDDILRALLDPAPTLLALLNLTLPMGPGRNFQGVGWQDLFAEKTRMDTMEWIGMHNVHSLTRTAKIHEDCMFRLWFCPPGLLHVEVHDDRTWSIADILSLPERLIIG